MNQGSTLQHIAVFAVIVVGMLSAALTGASLEQLAILLTTGALLLFILWDRHGPAMTAATPLPRISPTQELIDMPGFRKVVEGLSEPVLLVERGKVELANAGARKLLGNHIIGEDVRIAIRHPAAAERLTSPDPLEEPVQIDIVGLGTRNQRWSMQIIPIDETQGAQRLFVHLADESGAYAAERVRGDFVANASHELRTPLAAILGFVETLQDPNAGGDAKTRERFLSILENEAHRMQQLVDDLMSLSRIEADKYRLPATQIVMPALVEEVLNTCRQNLGTRGADIIAEISDDVTAIQGDRTQISQLLHNLVSNSAKYGRPGSPITVRLTAAPPSMIRLEVSDEGEGIAPDHLPRLTERFYRVDSGRSRAMGGTGLGLAIVKHIVERHRGRLDINSIIGKGTTVSVLLPLANVEAPEKKESQAPRLPVA
ncbi:MAG: ATP-binding protein [Sphingobium sp.]